MRCQTFCRVHNSAIPDITDSEAETNLISHEGRLIDLLDIRIFEGVDDATLIGGHMPPHEAAPIIYSIMALTVLVTPPAFILWAIIDLARTALEQKPLRARFVRTRALIQRYR